MKILYGISENTIDVTEICLTKLNLNNIITIPSGDVYRSNHFTDPIWGTLKKIFVVNENSITEYEYNVQLKIDILTNVVTVDNIDEKLSNLQNKLVIKHGSFNEEIPEQKMAIKYLLGNEKVLEIGGNIGRNSLIIASIVKDNLVTLECDTNISSQLQENRDLNKLHFHIENSALSKRKLIQRGWDTIPSDVLKPGYQWVNTISFDALQQKYNMKFDTLVLDCEGAFYYILMDMPEILNNIQLILMENDYLDITHKNYIDEILLKNKFIRIYAETGGWGPCYNNFFEAWKRI